MTKITKEQQLRVLEVANLVISSHGVTEKVVSDVNELIRMVLVSDPNEDFDDDILKVIGKIHAEALMRKQQ